MGMNEKVSAAVRAVAAIAEAIRELGQVPAGHLYAKLMGSMSLDQFEKIISILVKAGLVKRDASHLLHWVGPAVNA